MDFFGVFADSLPDNWGRLLLNRLLREHRQNLDELASQCQKILNTEYSDKLDELYQLGGTSGGARPKIMTEINGESWIITA